MSDVYDTHLHGIVCISGTSRPDNYTARALGIVVDELQHSRVAPVVFDARALQLAFPGHPDPGDGERLRTAIAAAPGVILATPEYHGSFAAMTKLMLENLGFPSVLAGKPVALVGVAAGRIGAIKSLEQLKSLPPDSHINLHACEEGWSYIAEWTGVRLAMVLDLRDISSRTWFAATHGPGQRP